MNLLNEQLNHRYPPLKYDGRRVYYAGAPKPIVTGVFNGTGTTNIAAGTYTWYIFHKYQDATGRVFYSDYTEHTETLSTGSEVRFVFQRPNVEMEIQGMGLGAYAESDGAYSGATFSTSNPHGIQEGDTLYFVDNSSTEVYNSNQTIETRTVTSTFEDEITLDSSITAVSGSKFAANQTTLILRTKNSGVTAYVVKEIPTLEYVQFWPSSLTFEFIDQEPDSSLVEPFSLPETGREGVRPPFATTACLHDGRMVYASGTNLYYSLPEAGRESIESVPRTNSLAIGSTQGGPVTAVGSAGDGLLYAFKEQGVYRISGLFESGESGLPVLKQSALSEGQYGCSNPNAIANVDGVLCVHGNGNLFGVSGDTLFPEIGKKINPRLKSFLQPNLVAYLANDHTTNQLKMAFVTKPERQKPGDFGAYNYIVMDYKHHLGPKTADANITLSRSVFDSSFFPWSWDVTQQPTYGFSVYQDDEYYLCIHNQFSLTTDTQHRNGLYRRWKRSELNTVHGANNGRKQFSDNGLAINYRINFTPLHINEVDVCKEWSKLKLFRFFTERDDENGITIPYAADVSLWTGLDNNTFSVLSSELTTEIEFKEGKDTQADQDIHSSGVALEVLLSVNELFVAPVISALYIGFQMPYDTDSMTRTARD